MATRPDDPWAEFRAPPPQQAPGGQGSIVLRPGGSGPTREPPAGYRWTSNGDLEAIPGGSADPNRPGGQQDPNRDPSVDQGKAAGFLRRANRSNSLYERLHIGAPSLVGEVARSVAPNAANYATDQERQQAISAQDEFIAATLRYESGAAIPIPEMEAQRRRYFPVPGDSEATIRQKADLRRTALEGLVDSAGPGAADALRTDSIQDIRDSIARADRRSPPEPSGGVQSEAAPGRAQIEVLLGEEPPAPEPPPGQRFVGWRAGPNAEYVPIFQPLERGDSADAEMRRRLILAINSGSPLGPLLQGISGTFGSESADAVRRGVNDAVTLGFADEIGGLITGNTDAERAIDAYDTENNFGARLSGQLAGGAALPGFGASRARELAALGAGYGGVYGVGSSQGSLRERAIDGLIGAGTGAVAGTILGVAGNRLFNGESRPANELIAAAERQSIDLLPADVSPSTRRLTAGIAQAPVGGGAIIRGAERTARQFDDRVAAIAADEGTPQPRNMLGETVQGAFDRFNQSSADEGRRAYEGARSLAGDRSYEGTRAVAALDRNIAELSENASTNAPLIEGLNRLRADLADGATVRGKSIDAIRQLRTAVRSEANTEGLRSTDYQRRAGQVLDELSEDIAAQLPPEAAAEFRRADTLWRERLDFIDDVEARILGPKNDRSAEAVTRRILDMSRSDSARFRRVLDQLPPEEAAVVRGTVIREMGRPPAGQPGDFSVETWARNFRELANNSRSVETLFRGANRDHANDLLTIAQQIEGTNKYRNFSNSSGAIAVHGLIQMLFTGGGGAAGGIPGAIAGAGGVTAITTALGRILGSPRVARILARPPSTTSRLVRRLGQVATREPALQNDIARISEILGRAANDNAASVARQAAAEPSQPRER